MNSTVLENYLDGIDEELSKIACKIRKYYIYGHLDWLGDVQPEMEILNSTLLEVGKSAIRNNYTNLSEKYNECAKKYDLLEKQISHIVKSTVTVEKDLRSDVMGIDINNAILDIVDVMIDASYQKVIFDKSMCPRAVGTYIPPS